MSETKSIVLRISPYRESDLIVTLLTQSNGKISCLARSARKSKHRFFSNLQVFDIGNFSFSKQKSKYFAIDSISNKKTLTLISNRASNFLLASLFAEIMDCVIPEEDVGYAELIVPFIKVLNNLTRVTNEFEQLSISTLFLLEVAKISGIDATATKGIFRQDDLKWLVTLISGNTCKYEPIEASQRAFNQTLSFIEETFQLEFRIKKQFPIIWKF
jgi:DNA repair protein RecO